MMVDTKIWDVRNYVDNLSTYPQIDEITSAFTAGEAVAVPTETVYGLAANALDPDAVDRIFKAKGRPGDNPLIIHIYDRQQLTFVEHIHKSADTLMKKFWPGPISFILPLKMGTIAANATGGLKTIAVRMPKDKITRQLLQLIELPLAAPSANLSGRPSPTSCAHVIEDLNGRIKGIVQGADSEIGLESTVLDCTSYPFKIARPGSITQDMLEAVVPGCITAADYQSDQPIAPGMKYRHYAPSSPMTLIEGGLKDDIKLEDHEAVIAPESQKAYVTGGRFISLCRDEEDILTAARKLYDVLRMMDHHPEITHIYISGFERTESARALMNRIDKACSGK